MNPTQIGFESLLHTAWQARDFETWQHHRSIYADWLEEQGHVLYRMAYCPVRCHAVRPRANLRSWMWRLYFDFPDTSWGKPRPRWWANRRVNARQLLGLPPYTLRCKGWEEETRTLRFTVVFRPHKAMHMRITGPRYQLQPVFEEVPVATDTVLHPDGFAAMFHTTTASVVREITPADRQGRVQQKELFS